MLVQSILAWSAILALHSPIPTLPSNSAPQPPLFGHSVGPNVPIPPNFVLTNVREASDVPHKWYAYLEDKKYDKAIDLWSSHPKNVYWNPGARKYLENIQSGRFLYFEDITDRWGGLPYNLQPFYAVKVYLSVIDIKTNDPNLVPGLEDKHIRRFFVVKDTQSSPWRLLMEQDMNTPELAELHLEIDLSKYFSH